MKLPNENLALAGFMSTGKNEVGGSIAERTGLRFTDLDQSIVHHYGGKSIKQIFAECGEPHFRATEHLLAGRVFHEHGQVISLGGGTFAQPGEDGEEARAMMLKNALVVWLDVDLPIIRERLAKKHDDRPLAQDPIAMEDLYWERRLYYRQAHVTVRIDVEVPVEEVAERVLQAISWKEAA